MTPLFLRGFQNLKNYDTFNLIEIKIDLFYKIMTNLQKYEKGNYKYCFIVNGILFSSGIKNDANISFITCNGLNDPRNSIINAKVYKSLRVVDLEQVKSWEKLKSVLNWVNAMHGFRGSVPVSKLHDCC